MAESADLVDPTQTDDEVVPLTGKTNTRKRRRAPAESSAAPEPRKVQKVASNTFLYEVFFDNSGTFDSKRGGCAVVARTPNHATGAVLNKLKRVQPSTARMVSLSQQSARLVGLSIPTMGEHIDEGVETDDVFSAFYCGDHHMDPGMLPGALVVARDETEARELLDSHLVLHDCKPFKKHSYTLQPIDISTVGVYV